MLTIQEAVNIIVRSLSGLGFTAKSEPASRHYDKFSHEYFPAHNVVVGMNGTQVITIKVIAFHDCLCVQTDAAAEFFRGDLGDQFVASSPDEEVLAEWVKGNVK